MEGAQMSWKHDLGERTRQLKIEQTTALRRPDTSVRPSVSFDRVHSAARHARENEKRPPGARHRTARTTAGSRPAPVPSRRPSSGRYLRGGPTCNVVRTTHVRPNQTAGPTAWPNRIYANFVSKTAPT